MTKKSILDLAMETAAQAHRKQVRKHTDIPYITHPFGVVLILRRYDLSDELIAAGLLHDVVEDSEMTIDDLRETFGDAVAEIVKGCSEPDKNAPWMVRKSHTIEFMKTAPLDTKLVSCADKLHNIRSIAADYDVMGNDVWNRFNEGQSGQEWYYRRLVESFASPPFSLEDYPLFKEFRKEVEELFRPKA